MTTRNDDVPPGWGDDELSAFLDKARHNQFGTFHKKKLAWGLISEVDACFYKLGSNLSNPKDLLSPFLFMRSHSAWRAACGTAMSGQVVETNALLRSALEFAAYGLYIDLTPDMRQVWFDRNNSGSAKKLMRNKFKQGTINAAIKARAPRLAEIFETLYELTIDQGAHPNQSGVMGSTKIYDIEDGGKRFDQVYLHGDSVALAATLKVLVETGICCLCLFQNVSTLKARFNLLGIGDRLVMLRKQSRVLVKKKA